MTVSKLYILSLIAYVFKMSALAAEQHVNQFTIRINAFTEYGVSVTDDRVATLTQYSSSNNLLFRGVPEEKSYATAFFYLENNILRHLPSREYVVIDSNNQLVLQSTEPSHKLSWASRKDQTGWEIYPMGFGSGTSLYFCTVTLSAAVGAPKTVNGFKVQQGRPSGVCGAVKFYKESK